MLTCWEENKAPVIFLRNTHVCLFITWRWLTNTMTGITLRTCNYALVELYRTRHSMGLISANRRHNQEGILAFSNTLFSEKKLAAIEVVYTIYLSRKKYTGWIRNEAALSHNSNYYCTYYICYSHLLWVIKDGLLRRSKVEALGRKASRALFNFASVNSYLSDLWSNDIGNDLSYSNCSA